MLSQARTYCLLLRSFFHFCLSSSTTCAFQDERLQSVSLSSPLESVRNVIENPSVKSSAVCATPLEYIIQAAVCPSLKMNKYAVVLNKTHEVSSLYNQRPFEMLRQKKLFRYSLNCHVHENICIHERSLQ